MNSLERGGHPSKPKISASLADPTYAVNEFSTMERDIHILSDHSPSILKT